VDSAAGGRNDDIPTFSPDLDEGFVLFVVGKFKIVGYLAAAPQPMHPFGGAFQVTGFDAVDKFTKTRQLGLVDELFICVFTIKVYAL